MLRKIPRYYKSQHQHKRPRRALNILILDIIKLFYSWVIVIAKIDTVKNTSYKSFFCFSVLRSSTTRFSFGEKKLFE